MRVTILLVFWGIVSICWSRDISCVVVDTNNAKLEAVNAKNINSKLNFNLNPEGQLVIEGLGTDTILFTSDGFYDAYFTIDNIVNSKNKVMLYSQMKSQLSEIVIQPIDAFSLYETAVQNLKNRMVINQIIEYNCSGTEIEVNGGEERSLEAIFTAELKNKRPKSSKFNYELLLSSLNINSKPTSTSKIIGGNKYFIYLLLYSLDYKLSKINTNTVYISDSTITIHSKDRENKSELYTINRIDTTLIAVHYEYNSPPDKGYKWLIDHSYKNMSNMSTYEFSLIDEGYYLSKVIRNVDTSFLIGKPKKEERFIYNYIVEAISLKNNKRGIHKFKPYSTDLFKKGNFKGMQ